MSDFKLNKDFKNEPIGTGFRHKDTVQYLGELRIIGRVLDGSKVVGYVIMHEKSGRFKPYNTDQTKSLLRKFQFVNAEIVDGEIKNLECSMDKLMGFDMHMRPIHHIGILILAEVLDINNKLIAYKVLDHRGIIIELSEKDLIRAHRNGFNLINAKLISRGGKSFVSAIRKEFTVIRRVTEYNTTDNSKETVATHSDCSMKDEGKSCAARFRHKQHINKLLNKTLYSYFTGTLKEHGNLGNRLFRGFIKYRKGDVNKQGGANIKKEIHIICTEIAAAMLNKDTQKEVFKEFWNDHAGMVKDIVEENDLNVDWEFWFGLAQLSLLIPENRERLLNDSKVKRSLLRNKNGKNVYSARITKFAEKGYMLPEVKNTLDLLAKEIEELDLKATRESEMVDKRIFKTQTFTTSKDAAQLGFAVSEKMDGYRYTTDTGSEYKLKYICKYIPEFESYRPLVTCLGDILLLANIERIWSLGTDDRLNINDEEIKPELMLGILALYNPTLCKEYINRRKESFEPLGDMLPYFDFDNLVDYKLDPRLRLYYESGCCVFYNDTGHNYGGADYWVRNKVKAPQYKRRNLQEAKILNYRSLKGPNRPIAHDLLYTELAPILNMITSDACTSDLIERFVGRLRAL